MSVFAGLSGWRTDASMRPPHSFERPTKTLKRHETQGASKGASHTNIGQFIGALTENEEGLRL